MRLSRILVCTLVIAHTTGCSLFSPFPIWELTKATGEAIGTVVTTSDGKASNTVSHGQPAPKVVCLEFNPQVQAPDLVPALQAEMHARQVRTRVYDSIFESEFCEAWLKYTAFIRWDKPPMSSDYRPYIESASLTLVTVHGRVLAASEYVVDERFGTSRWASTRNKISAAVSALLTGEGA